jgi:MoaA/NifB/PqqE/SkfB family radical SAM enzyme
MEMDIETIEGLVSEARKLGVFTIMFAGGEPLMKHGLLDLMGRHKDMLFVFFTNGLLMDANVRKSLSKMHHVVPAISLEGTREITDKRRGRGIYDTTMKTLKALDSDRLLFGTSITLTRENYDTVINTDYLATLETRGCCVVFLIEYVPCNGDTEMCLSSEQKSDYLAKIPVLRQQNNMLMVSLPGDESKYNGCLAAGRGFIHISSTGYVEACPFAPYADVNVKDTTLQQALKSQLLSNIRANHHLLEEANGGCTLFENKAWVESLTHSSKGKIGCNALI